MKFNRKKGVITATIFGGSTLIGGMAPTVSSLADDSTDGSKTTDNQVDFDSILNTANATGFASDHKTPANTNPDSALVKVGWQPGQLLAQKHVFDLNGKLIDEKEVKVGQVVNYQITVTNTKENSLVKNVTIKDAILPNLIYQTGTLTAVRNDHKKVTIDGPKNMSIADAVKGGYLDNDSKAAHSGSGFLIEGNNYAGDTQVPAYSVAGGDLKYKDTITVKFKVKIKKADDNNRAMNQAMVTGFNPSKIPGGPDEPLPPLKPLVPLLLTPQPLLIKKVDKQAAKVGDKVTYTLILKNSGAGDWKNVVAKDNLDTRYIEYVPHTTKIQKNVDVANGNEDIIENNNTVNNQNTTGTGTNNNTANGQTPADSESTTGNDDNSVNVNDDNNGLTGTNGQGDSNSNNLENGIDNTSGTWSTVSDQGAWSNNKLSLPLGDIKTNKSDVIQFQVKVKSAAEGKTIPNLFTATGFGPNGKSLTPPPSNVVYTKVPQPKLVTTKHVLDPTGAVIDGKKVKKGDKLHYVITATPQDSDMKSVSIKDVMPQGTTYVPNSVIGSNNGKKVTAKYDQSKKEASVSLGALANNMVGSLEFDVTINKDTTLKKIHNVADVTGISPNGKVFKGRPTVDNPLSPATPKSPNKNNPQNQPNKNNPQNSKNNPQKNNPNPLEQAGELLKTGLQNPWIDILLIAALSGGGYYWARKKGFKGFKK